jgi:hypothetical protein
MTVTGRGTTVAAMIGATMIRVIVAGAVIIAKN